MLANSIVSVKREEDHFIFQDAKGGEYSLGTDADPFGEDEDRNKVFYLVDSHGNQTGLVVKMPWLSSQRDSPEVAVDNKPRAERDERELTERFTGAVKHVKKTYVAESKTTNQVNQNSCALLHTQEDVPFLVMPDKGISLIYYLNAAIKLPHTMRSTIGWCGLQMISALYKFQHENPQSVHLDMKKANVCFRGQSSLIDFEHQRLVGEMGVRIADHLPAELQQGKTAYTQKHDLYGVLHFFVELREDLINYDKSLVEEGEEPVYRGLISLFKYLPNPEEYESLTLKDIEDEIKQTLRPKAGIEKVLPVRTAGKTYEKSLESLRGLEDALYIRENVETGKLDTNPNVLSSGCYGWFADLQMRSDKELVLETRRAKDREDALRDMYEELEAEESEVASPVEQKRESKSLEALHLERKELIGERDALKGQLQDALEVHMLAKEALHIAVEASPGSLDVIESLQAKIDRALQDQTAIAEQYDTSILRLEVIDEEIQERRSSVRGVGFFEPASTHNNEAESAEIQPSTLGKGFGGS